MSGGDPQLRAPRVRRHRPHPDGGEEQKTRKSPWAPYAAVALAMRENAVTAGARRIAHPLSWCWVPCTAYAEPRFMHACDQVWSPGGDLRDDAPERWCATGPEQRARLAARADGSGCAVLRDRRL